MTAQRRWRLALVPLALLLIACSDADSGATTVPSDTVAPAADSAPGDASPLTAVPPVPDTPVAHLYREKCGVCHQVWGGFPGSGVELLHRTRGPEAAMLDARTDLQPDYIRAVVRSGLVVMPPLTRGEVSDAELEQIIEYLTVSGPAFQSSP